MKRVLMSTAAAFSAATGYLRRRQSRGGVAALGLAFLTLATTTPCRAQEVRKTVELVFANPGARSMGFGGAFAALADDATAAFANPAGLVQLLRPELSGELRLSVDLGDIRDDSDVIGGFGLGFVSFVYPGRRWSLAVYKHTLATLEIVPGSTSSGSSGGAWPRAMTAVANPLRISLEIDRWGFSGGYRLDERLSLGLGVSYFKGTVRSSPAVIYYSDFVAGSASGSRRTDSTDFGLNGGVVWSLSQRWNAAGFFREGPELSVDLGTGPAQNLSLPDTYGLGTSFRSPGGALTLAFEWDRIGYSSLADSLGNHPAFSTLAASEDADELHIGAEYAFLKRSPIVALRLGAWLDSRHRPSWTGIGEDVSKGDEVHIATGLGWAFERFQIDLGLDYSDTAISMSISGIVSF